MADYTSPVDPESRSAYRSTYGYQPQVAKRFWETSKRQGWTTESKLLALYLLTSRHSVSEGYYHIPRLYMMADLGFSAATLTKSLRQLTADKFLVYDDKVEVVVILNALKYNVPGNPNQVKHAVRIAQRTPVSPLLGLFFLRAKQFSVPLADALAETFGMGFLEGLGKGVEGFPEGFGHPATNYELQATNHELQATIQPLSSGEPPDPPAENPKPVKGVGRQVDEVFRHWVETMGKSTTTVLTPKRRARIEDRLKEGYSVADLRLAIEGARASPFHMGENDRSTMYNDIELICRSGEKVEAFMQLVASDPVREGRIRKALMVLQAGGADDGARRMVHDDDEWDDVLRRRG